MERSSPIHEPQSIGSFIEHVESRDGHVSFEITDGSWTEDGPCRPAAQTPVEYYPIEESAQERLSGTRSSVVVAESGSIAGVKQSGTPSKKDSYSTRAAAYLLSFSVFCRDCWSVSVGTM